MASVKKIPIIAVMGSGTQPYQDKAEKLGKWIATAGYHLLTGAGAGVMNTVSQAFCQTEGRKGLSIGIVPGQIENETYKASPGYPNPFIEIPIFTHLPLSGSEGTATLSRNHINILSAHLVIALPGAQGTKSEILLALRYNKPVLGFFRNAVEIFAEDLPVECIESFEQLTRRIKEILK